MRLRELRPIVRHSPPNSGDTSMTFPFQKSERSGKPRPGVIAFGLVAIACGLGPACGSNDSPAQKSGSGGSTNDAASDADADAASDSVLPGKGTLGASCTDDSQCGADGSVCLKATDAAWVADGDVANGTGPAGGYCSVDCSDYYDGLTDVDPCAALGGYCYLRWCLEGCSFGPGLLALE